MGDYATVSDVLQYINIDKEDMTTEEIEKRITEAESWVNDKQNVTTFDVLPDTPDRITKASAKKAGSLILDFLFSTTAPDQSAHGKRLEKQAEEELKLYDRATVDPESYVEKVNEDFFDD